MAANTYYENTPLPGLKVNGGEVGTFVLPYPTRVRLTKVFVIQTAGDPVAYTVDLFNKAEAAADESLSDAEGPDTGPLSPELFRVGPVLSSSAPGVLQHFYTADEPVFFISHDDQSGSIMDARRLHLRISPAGSGEKEFAVVIGSIQHAN